MVVLVVLGRAHRASERAGRHSRTSCLGRRFGPRLTSPGEAATYQAVQQLAERSWPRWLVLYGWGSRKVYAIAAFLPNAYVLADPDPVTLARHMRYVETSGRLPA